MYTPICAEVGMVRAIPNSTPRIQFNLILVSPVCLVLWCGILLVSCLNSRQNPEPRAHKDIKTRALKRWEKRNTMIYFPEGRPRFPCSFLPILGYALRFIVNFRIPNQKKLSGAASQIYETNHRPLGLKLQVNGLPYTSE